MELESHKQVLSIMTESSKFEYQRMMHDFSLYRNKKHEIYPELFQKIMLGYNNIHELHYVWSWLNFRKFNKEKLKSVLLAMEFASSEKIDMIIADWETSKDEIVQDIKFHSKLKELLDCRDLFMSAYAYYSYNEVFLSEEFIAAYLDFSFHTDNYFYCMRKLIIKRCLGLDEDEREPETRSEIESKVNEHLSAIEDIIVELKKLIKRELSIADYDSINKKKN
ncbi:hypothetical protein [Paenibacillus sp. FJAT-26967]|uniref:hypothetical protein n=1 Tax=Paenibacillus sp. FJAT-26967 TaxID=1729690 RepID=UPI00083951ED|nr:hypothetical protein [Paenibacillus sp. FJAT-26967]